MSRHNKLLIYYVSHFDFFLGYGIFQNKLSVSDASPRFLKKNDSYFLECFVAVCKGEKSCSLCPEAKTSISNKTSIFWSYI
jgi:hypothetical protein